MPFQSVPDCAEAVINGIADGKPIANVFGFRFPGGYAQSDITALAAALDTEIGADYLPQVSVGVSYGSTLVRGLTLINDFTSVASAAAGVGGVSGGALPSNVTACITLRSALTGRSARGRFYAFPTGDSQRLTENRFTSAYLSGLVTFLTGVQTIALSIGWEFSVLSRRTGGALRASGVAFKITSIAARNDLIDSQRGRLPAGH